MSQTRGGEAEREAETDERNVGTLRTGDHLEGSQLHLFAHRYDAITADITVESMLKPDLFVILLFILSKSSDNQSGKHRSSKVKERAPTGCPQTQVSTVP